MICSNNNVTDKKLIGESKPLPHYISSLNMTLWCEDKNSKLYH